LANKRILVAGIGNIFLGDDAFGCEVAQRLFKRAIPEDVRVVDFGIRGFDLAYALLENYELSILIDVTPRGGAPGSLYVIEVNANLDELEADEMPLDTHAMNPLRVLGLVKSMGGELKRTLIVGCEPSEASEQEEIRLSKSVTASLDKAVELVESLIARHLDHGAVSTPKMQPVALP
jgi:hydrogenase maturation protease